MEETRISLSELDLVAATRAAIGFGLGLLLANHFSAGQRRAIGWALVLAGGVSTIPLLIDILSHTGPSRSARSSPSAAWDRVAEHVEQSYRASADAASETQEGNRGARA